MNTQPILAIDYGTRHWGLALAQAGLSQPLATIHSLTELSPFIDQF